MRIIDDPKPVLRAACRVLRPGGRLVVITQAKEPLEGPLWASVRQAMTWHTDAELRTLLTTAGFSDVEAYPTGDMGQLGYGIKS